MVTDENTPVCDNVAQLTDTTPAQNANSSDAVKRPADNADTPSDIASAPTTAKKVKLSAEEKAALALQREQEKERKRIEKEQREAEKEARRLEKEAEKKRKDEEREMERRKREEERLKKEEEKRIKDEEREVERRKRDEERLKKEEERLKKEEERKKKLEEKQREEDEKRREREKEQRLKEKQSAKLLSLFKKATPSKADAPQSPKDAQPVWPIDKFFLPFEVKEHVSLAPLTRRTNRTAPETIDAHLGIDPPLSSAALLAELKQSKGRHALPPITVAADPAAAHGTIKLLRFHDNYRPAYYGTYSKTSAAVTGRHPLARDAVLFNYEYDSEDDWEEEEEGEDILSNDEDEQDAQEEEDDEDGFVVPHGYLSDDEGAAEHDDRLAKSDCLADAAAPRKRFEPLLPKVVGCVWETGDQSAPDLEFMSRFRAVTMAPVPIAVAGREVETRTPVGSKKATVAVDVVVQILTDIHGSDSTKEALVATLNDKYPQASKTWLRTILATAVVKEKRDGNTASRWYVRDEVLKEHNIQISPRRAPTAPSQAKLKSFFSKAKKTDGGPDSPKQSVANGEIDLRSPDKPVEGPGRVRLRIEVE